MRAPRLRRARALAPRPSTTQTVRTVGRATLGRGSLLDVGHRTLAELPEKLWDAPAVAHALAARAALAQGNAVAFLRLHQSCPNMGAYLLDAVADAVRTDAAARVLRAFRPTVPPACLAAQLGFDDAGEARAFAARLGFVFDARGDCLVRESRCDPTKLDEKKKSSLL